MSEVKGGKLVLKGHQNMQAQQNKSHRTLTSKLVTMLCDFFARAMLRAVSRAADDLRRLTGIPGGREGPVEGLGGAVLKVPPTGRAEPTTGVPGAWRGGWRGVKLEPSVELKGVVSMGLRRLGREESESDPSERGWMRLERGAWACF